MEATNSERVYDPELFGFRITGSINQSGLGKQNETGYTFA